MLRAASALRDAGHLLATDPSGARPNLSSRFATSPWFRPASSSASCPPVPVAGVAGSAEDLLGPVQVPPMDEQAGQPLGGVPVAGVGPGAQLAQVAASGQCDLHRCLAGRGLSLERSMTSRLRCWWSSGHRTAS